MITINFSREMKLAWHPGFDGFGGDFIGHGEDPYFEVCRAMADCGYPDGPGVFVDERGVPCLTVKSVHSCARRYRPNPADAAAKTERVDAKKKRRSRKVA